MIDTAVYSINERQAHKHVHQQNHALLSHDDVHSSLVHSWHNYNREHSLS